MRSKVLNILLADDDSDDRLFFKMALDEMSFPTILATVVDGEKLMEQLGKDGRVLPDVLYLDLNMPRKNGFECLSEIKRNKDLQHLPVVIFSTSYEQEMVNLLYKNGAHYYMRKPAQFAQLKQIIEMTVDMISQEKLLQPQRENFVLTVQS